MTALARRLAVALCFGFAITAAAAADVPYLSGRVVDDAEILSPAARGRLTTGLKAHEQRTGNQIAVLTVPTIHGESIEEYALQVFEAWKLGQRDKDNGVLVVVVPKDRRMRIEVGYGLEGALPDIAAARIVRNIMSPQFKAGDFDRGVEGGVAAIVAHLEGRASPSDPASGDISSPSIDSVTSGLQVPDLPLTERILFGAFIFGIIGLFTIIGVMTPGVGWFLYLFLIPFWAMFPIVVVGTEGALALLACYLVGFPLAKLLFARTKWYDKAKTDLKTKGHASVGGFSVGRSSSSSSSWSSSSSSSSFSGGGGRSGGGGSSGSW
jgi:uncharacterized protein